MLSNWYWLQILQISIKCRFFVVSPVCFIPVSWLFTTRDHLVSPLNRPLPPGTISDGEQDVIPGATCSSNDEYSTREQSGTGVLHRCNVFVARIMRSRVYNHGGLLIVKNFIFPLIFVGIGRVLTYPVPKNRDRFRDPNRNVT